jgi:stage V sporulation protein SpoVS
LLLSQDQELQRDQDLQRDQNNTSVSSSDPLDAAACQLRSSDPEQQAVALETLWSATCADSVDAATKIHAAGMVPCLTQLLSSPDHRVQVGAAATLGNVLRELPAACTQAAAAGAVPTLIQLLGSDPDDVLLPRYAVGALESIADDAEQGSAGMQAAVEPLVQLLSCDDISTQSRGVGCLWSVMRHDEEAREQAVAAGATQHLVQLLQCAVAICDPALLHRCLMSVGVLSTHPTAQR